jgi:hypothetical protein
VSINKWRGIRKEMESHCIYNIADGFVHDPVAAERIEYFQGKSDTNTRNINERWSDTPRAEDAS